MIEGKTAALIAASCAMGALLGGASEDEVDALCEYGRCTGMAFQIRDDVLGIWGDAEETGKPTSDDLRAAKQSYPVVIALERKAGADRDRLLELLKKETRDDEEIETARKLLEHLGVREESERVAMSHADAAIASLDSIGVSAKWRSDLASIASFAADRSA